MTCPCGLGANYAACCGRFHRGQAHAPTAERLMRARFSAFAVQDEPYLIASWHPSTRPQTLGLDPLQRWVRLDVLATERGALLDTEGTVEFEAHHEGGVLHEVSRFVRHERLWVYLGPLEFTRT